MNNATREVIAALEDAQRAAARGQVVAFHHKFEHPPAAPSHMTLSWTYGKVDDTGQCARVADAVGLALDGFVSGGVQVTSGVSRSEVAKTRTVTLGFHFSASAGT